MFTNERCKTCGVQSVIPLPLQNLLWTLVDSMRVRKKDELQVFRLEIVSQDGTEQQKIIHTQEKPPYRWETTVDLCGPVDAKVYVIDDGEHTTMLLASEY